MKLRLNKQNPGDKCLTIIDEDKPYGLNISVDFDDVNHEEVLQDTKALIERVNLFNSISRL